MLKIDNGTRMVPFIYLGKIFDTKFWKNLKITLTKKLTTAFKKSSGNSPFFGWINCSADEKSYNCDIFQANHWNEIVRF